MWFQFIFFTTLTVLSLCFWKMLNFECFVLRTFQKISFSPFNCVGWWGDSTSSVHKISIYIYLVWRFLKTITDGMDQFDAAALPWWPKVEIIWILLTKVRSHLTSPIYSQPGKAPKPPDFAVIGDFLCGWVRLHLFYNKCLQSCRPRSGGRGGGAGVSRSRCSNQILGGS